MRKTAMTTSALALIAAVSSSMLAPYAYAEEKDKSGFYVVTSHPKSKSSTPQKEKTRSHRVATSEKNSSSSEDDESSSEESSSLKGVESSDEIEIIPRTTSSSDGKDGESSEESSSEKSTEEETSEEDTSTEETTSSEAPTTSAQRPYSGSKYEYVAPPINPLPSFFSMNSRGKLSMSDYNTPPPINPLPGGISRN